MDQSANLQSRLLSHLGEGDAGHDAGHARRVWALCQEIAAGEGITAGHALLAAACLHDLIALPKGHPNRAQASHLSAEAARPIMAAEGLGDADIEIAAHAITAHSFSANIIPETPEAEILQDADRLEALGAIGIARVFAISGELGRELWNDTDPFAENRPLDDTRWSLDHFEIKLLKLPAQMNTESGKKLAEDRTDRMTCYLNELRDELGV